MVETKEFWEQIYRNNAPKLLGVCRRYVKDLKLAEDLMHDAFMTAIKKSGSYSGKGDFEAWLRRVTINTVLMHLRATKNDSLPLDKVVIAQNTETMNDNENMSPRHLIENADFSKDELLQVIDILPEHHRMVFNLYVIDNFSHKQIAEQLNISVGTSKSHLGRARKKIQKLLEEKALEKSIHKNKRKRSLLPLLFMSSDGSKIDKLFKDVLNDLNFQHTDCFQSIANQIDWTAIPPHTDFLNKTQLPPSPRQIFTIAAGASTGVVALITGIYFITKSPETSPNTKKEEVEYFIEKDSSYLNQTHKRDTSVTINKNQLPSDDKIDTSFTKPNQPEVNKKPVVVKRTIVKRKKIYVRDTVRIIDSTTLK